VSEPRPVTDGHHVALTVTDLGRAEAWWRRLFAAEEVLREDGDGRRAVILRLLPSAFLVGLVEHRAGDRQPFDPRRTGLDHVALTVADRADLDAWAEHLDRHGIAHSGVVDLPVGAILNTADPDGIAVALFWDAPR